MQTNMQPKFSFDIGEQRFVFLNAGGAEGGRAEEEFHEKVAEIPRPDLDKTARVEPLKEVYEQAKKKLETFEDPNALVDINKKLLKDVNAKLGLNFSIQNIKELVGFTPLEPKPESTENNKEFIGKIRDFQNEIGVGNDGKFGMKTMTAAIDYAQAHGERGKPGATIAGEQIAEWLGGKQSVNAVAQKIDAYKTEQIAKAAPATAPVAEKPAAVEIAAVTPPKPAEERGLEGAYKAQFEHIQSNVQSTAETIEALWDEKGRIDVPNAAQVLSDSLLGKVPKERIEKAIAAAGSRQEFRDSINQFIAMSRNDILAQQTTDQKEAPARKELADRYGRIYDQVFSLAKQIREASNKGDSKKANYINDTLVRFGKANLELTDTQLSDLALGATSMSADVYAKQVTKLALQNKGMSVEDSERAETTYMASR